MNLSNILICQIKYDYFLLNLLVDLLLIHKCKMRQQKFKKNSHHIHMNRRQ